MVTNSSIFNFGISFNESPGEKTKSSQSKGDSAFYGIYKEVRGLNKPAVKRGYTENELETSANKQKLTRFKNNKNFELRSISAAGENSSETASQPIETIYSSEIENIIDNNQTSNEELLYVAVTEALAFLLGISDSQAEQLLHESGITSQTMSLENAPHVISTKLSELAGLTKEHQSSISKLMNNTFEFINEFISESTADSSQAGVLAQTEGPIIKESEDDQKDLLKGIRINTEEIKKMLDNTDETQKLLANKLSDVLPRKIIQSSKFHSSAQQESISQSSEEIQSIMEHADIRIQATPEQSGSSGKSYNEDISSREKGQSSFKLETATKMQDEVLVNDTGNKASDAENTFYQSVSTVVRNDTTENYLKNETIPPKQEIINQIVEKVKVVLSSDKSEMVIDLKPDHLGKLSMKVVTESGIVSASFIAENQQVKEILQTNMQLLKDSLEKQGLEFQSLSVSVGQHNTGGNNGDSMESKSQWHLKRMGIKLNDANPPEILATAAKAYGLYGSTINLTA